jgi:hypothetical protein
MAKPLGMIIDPNPITTASDVYALVLNNTVINTIMASANDIQSIAATYDYSVDITMQGQAFAYIGCSYNGATNQFTRPPAPPINWVQNVELDFDTVIEDIQQILNDAGESGGNLSPTQLLQAYNSALNDNPNLDVPTLTLIASIYQYVLAGG